MGIMDDIKNKGDELLNDPATKSKIEQIAKDKGLTLDQAKQDFLNQKSSGK